MTDQTQIPARSTVKLPALKYHFTTAQKLQSLSRLTQLISERESELTQKVDALLEAVSELSVLVEKHAERIEELSQSIQEYKKGCSH
jgi:predicted  nucleic acid-binding Zn-ribbon protein